jgi:hypothetical protein
MEGGHFHDDIEEGEVLRVVEKYMDFTLIAIIGIRDVIREEVPEAVKDC